MVKRVSSKERLQQMAEEAAAGEEQKAEKKKKATTVKKTAKSIIKREKVVWKVFDASYKEVACFPYSEKDDAFAKLEERKQKKSGTTFFINEVKVPMEDV
ncbi:MAG: hypothetical protein H8D23_31270 [Candidatus Brocadiales bacterium]|nr:hypothetical protein [Candidatus Brocadiales bacterium]